MWVPLDLWASLSLYGSSRRTLNEACHQPMMGQTTGGLDIPLLSIIIGQGNVLSLLILSETFVCILVVFFFAFVSLTCRCMSQWSRLGWVDVISSQGSIYDPRLPCPLSLQGLFPTTNGVPPTPPRPVIVLVVRNNLRGLTNNNEVCVRTTYTRTCLLFTKIDWRCNPFG